VVAATQIDPLHFEVDLAHCVLSAYATDTGFSTDLDAHTGAAAPTIRTFREAQTTLLWTRTDRGTAWMSKPPGGIFTGGQSSRP